MATPIEESNDGLECFTFAYKDNNQVDDLIKFELHVSQDVADLLREGIITLAFVKTEELYNVAISATIFVSSDGEKHVPTSGALLHSSVLHQCCCQWRTQDFLLGGGAPPRVPPPPPAPQAKIFGDVNIGSM